MKRIILCIALATINLAVYSQEPIIGETYYDLQTNGSCQNRIYVYEDGTIGTTWTRGMEYFSFVDRGTGYNYFDGSVWQPWPEERIENQRCGWPSYAPYGESGELVVAHLSGADTVGLLFNKRTIKGTGGWTESLFTGPVGNETLLWPRMVTGGLNHEHIFLIAFSSPEANGGDPYQGLDGALLYSRSINGGNSWDIQNQIFPGMDSTEYNGFAGDCYAIAEPKDNIIAFVVGSFRTDMFLMKSIDYGQTFEKTIIWDNPYDTILPADTFYCVDGSVAVALDVSGKAHVVFGITNLWYNGGWYGDRSIDGIGYWNEDRPVFSSEVNALNPTGGPGSEMVTDYNLIGWAQDITGDGIVTYSPYNSFGYCNHYSVSSMVQLVTDDQNRIFIFYTSVTETYNNGIDNYRRLWSRSSLNGGETWGQFYHFFADDTTTIFNEYAFPSCAARSDDYIHLVAMIDMAPGIYNCPEENYYENNFQYIKVSKVDIVGIEPVIEKPGFEVSQNFPNPFSESTLVKVNLSVPANLTLDILNLLGQKVGPTKYFNGLTGNNNLKIERANLSPGVYYYNVRAGENSVTKKMIVK
jgi:hypothetical protein